MQITGVSIQKKESRKSSVVAVASVYFDDQLVIHGVKLVIGRKGYFCAFPSAGKKCTNEGDVKYSDIVHPLNAELRMDILNAILEKYNR